MRLIKFFILSLILALHLPLVGCLEPIDPFADESGDEEIPDSGSSTFGAPTSVIGQMMIQTVTWNDKESGTIAEGGTITYSFIDANTILGDGLEVIPTVAWNYSKSGNKGEIFLDYGSAGHSKEEITFTSETSGTYRSQIYLAADNSDHEHGGTFIIKPVESDPNDPNEPDECTSTNGQLTIYTSDGTSEDISVYVDGGYAGLLTHYFTSGGPTCGEPTGISQVTLTLPAGNHTVSAESASYTWSGGSIQVAACGCSTYRLY